MTLITKNLHQLYDELGARLGRDWRDRLTLVAVSKMAPAEAVREAFAEGQVDFGENRVQELVAKREALVDLPIRWHLIGHLQTNKVKNVIGAVELVQSVDSLRLAEALWRECEKRETTCRVLLEVKTTAEQTKTGVSIEECRELARQVLEMDRIVLDGLMTMAPATGGPESARESFRTIRDLHEELRSAHGLGYRGTILSMGMSGDYSIGLEEGSTMVRIGTRIFGERQQ